MNPAPFTAAVCHGQACGREHGRSVIEGLRGAVRRQPHGVLVSTGCLLGRLGCHAVTHRAAGALLVVQPCSVDREPVGRSVWIGPLSGEDDLAEVRRWLENGDLYPNRLPARLKFRVASAGAN